MLLRRKMSKFHLLRPRNFLTYSGFCFCLISFLSDSEHSEACQNPEYTKYGKALILDSLALNLEMMKLGLRLTFFATYLLILFFNYFIFVCFNYFIFSCRTASRPMAGRNSATLHLKFTHGEAVNRDI